VSEPFFGRALCLALLTLAVPLALGRAAGWVYHPHALAPQAAEISASDHFVALFGNSRFEAAIDPARLAETLSTAGSVVKAQAFNGGGWDALHYYMLAIENREALRPERDLAVMEVSPKTLDDSDAGNRLGTLRPEAARAIVSLPGEPLETRLDVLCGAVAALYRYRVSLQSVALAPRLTRLAERIGGLLGRVHVIGPPPATPRYRLVLAPGRDFVIEDVQGDRSALTAASRRQSQLSIGAVRVGGFKTEALRRAIRVLKSRGIAVVLVETPTSEWMDALAASTPALSDYGALVRRLAQDEGARLEREWPRPLHGEQKFWDDLHMVSSAAEEFTKALSARLAGILPAAGAAPKSRR
jgi:hypothetical protein